MQIVGRPPAVDCDFCKNGQGPWADCLSFQGWKGRHSLRTLALAGRTPGVHIECHTQPQCSARSPRNSSIQDQIQKQELVDEIADGQAKLGRYREQSKQLNLEERMVILQQEAQLQPAGG